MIIFLALFFLFPPPWRGRVRVGGKVAMKSSCCMLHPLPDPLPSREGDIFGRVLQEALYSVIYLPL